jgi:hypothetical protein
MTTAMFFIVYPAVFIAGAILTQLAGNAHRPFHEGILAWLFLPVGMLACISAWLSEGLRGLKETSIEFSETLLNFHFHRIEEKHEDAHRVKGDLA